MNICKIIENLKRRKMTIITTEYKYKVLLRLLNNGENFTTACSKAGLSKKEANTLLNEK